MQRKSAVPIMLFGLELALWLLLCFSHFVDLEGQIIILHTVKTLVCKAHKIATKSCIFMCRAHKFVCYTHILDDGMIVQWKLACLIEY